MSFCRKAVKWTLGWPSGSKLLFIFEPPKKVYDEEAVSKYKVAITILVSVVAALVLLVIFLFASK